MLGIGKSNKQTTKQKSPLGKDVEHLFPKQARQSDLCRTLSYTYDDTPLTKANQFGEEWLEARAIADTGEWIIQRINYRPPNPAESEQVATDAMIKDCNPYTDKPISFMEMLRKLSTYEHSAQDTGRQQQAAPSLEELGDKHYTKAALKEGVLIDIYGNFSPTEKGTPVIKGKFLASLFDELAAQQAQIIVPNSASLEKLMTQANLAQLSENIDMEQAPGLIANMPMITAAINLFIETNDRLIWRLSEKKRDSYIEYRFKRIDKFHKTRNGSDGDKWAVLMGKPLRTLGKVISLIEHEHPQIGKLLKKLYAEFYVFVISCIMHDTKRRLSNSDYKNYTARDIHGYAAMQKQLSRIKKKYGHLFPDGHLDRMYTITLLHPETMQDGVTQLLARHQNECEHIAQSIEDNKEALNHMVISSLLQNQELAEITDQSRPEPPPPQTIPKLTKG